MMNGVPLRNEALEIQNAGNISIKRQGYFI